jgi:hypothetical protein
MRLHSLLSLAVLLALPGGDGPMASQGESAQAHCQPLGPRIEQRIERFVLESRTTDERGNTRADVAGFVVWRRRDDADGPQLELDVRFLRGSPGTNAVREVQHVLQIECLTDRGPRCQWREVGGSGRSVQAEWSTDGGALDVVEWSAAGKKRGTMVASGGVSMPLYLAELVRAGRITAGPVTQFDPLGRTLEPLMVRTVWLESAPAPVETVNAGDRDDGTDAAPRAPRDERTVELLRTDGTLAARYRFAGLDLVSFQWQEGRLTARAVDEATFERLAAEQLPNAAAPGRRSH